MSRRLIRAIAALLLLTYFHPALGEDKAQQNRAVVEALFAAVAGTTTEEERVLREDMTKEENVLRDAQNAAYRARALPWLMASLGAEAASASDEDPEIPWDPTDAYALFGTTRAGAFYIALLAERGCGDAESCLSATRAACGDWLAEVDADALSQINPDYACWIYCPDSRIDYPVVRGKDNSDYLDKLFDRTPNACGTLFMDARNLADFGDPNTLIYGHHMRDGSMFKSVTFYGEQAYYEAHPYMLILTPTQTLLVELFAGYVARADDSCYDIAIGDPEDFAGFARAVKEKSAFAADCAIGAGDRLVTLSTCAYSFADARFVLIGKLALLKSSEQTTRK
jgi:sortase B